MVEDPGAEKNKEEYAADFETAIEASGFGLFNILLLFIAMFAASATVFETSTISYILPSAECDLNLSMLDKGVLNAVTYAGMITSAIAWGYVSDTYGRKNILVFGFITDALCVLGSAMTQNYMHLILFKYLGGFVICGPFAVLMTYLTELHGKKKRARVMMLIGMMFSIASLTLPTLASAVLPRKWDFNIFNLTIHSWQIFLAISSIPSFISGSFLIFFPESPKFLMSQGRNEEALEVFRMIYAANRHKEKNTYPIQSLLREASDNRRKLNGGKESSSFSESLVQLRPLFSKPHLGLSLHVYLMNFFILLGQNTIRLWLPQLFASLEELERLSPAASDICATLVYSMNKTQMADTCTVGVTAASYTNNIIVALSGFGGYIIAGLLVNSIGSKWILNIALAIAGTCGFLLYWSPSAMTTLILSALFVTMGSISSTSVISSSVSLFPTSLRTMIVSLAMMFGRCGSLLGNVIFPILMGLGCIPPFLLIGMVMYASCFLSIFLPNTKKSELK